MFKIKYRLLIIFLFWIGATSGVYAIDLYVDTTTKQIFTEAGPGRERLGTFKRVEDKPAQAQATVNDAMTNRNRRRGRGRIRVRGRSTQDKEGQIKTADALPLRNRDAELKVEADRSKNSDRKSLSKSTELSCDLRNVVTVALRLLALDNIESASDFCDSYHSMVASLSSPRRPMAFWEDSANDLMALA